MTELDIARGRKQIMKLLGVQDWGTVRDWNKRYNLPLRRFPGPKQIPFLLPNEVKAWLVKYSELKNKQ